MAKLCITACLMVVLALFIFPSITQANESAEAQTTTLPAEGEQKQHTNDTTATRTAKTGELCEDNLGCDPECREISTISNDLQQQVGHPGLDHLISSIQTYLGVAEFEEFQDFGSNIEKLTEALNAKLQENQEGLNNENNVGKRFSPSRYPWYAENPGKKYCKSGMCRWTRIPNRHTGTTGSHQNNAGSTEHSSNGNSTREVPTGNETYWMTLAGICVPQTFEYSLNRRSGGTQNFAGGIGIMILVGINLLTY